MLNNAKFNIRRVAVLGAGVMGAQIAALFTNAQVETLLYDLASDGKDPDLSVKNAIVNLTRLKPAPLGTVELATNIIAANYTDNLDLLERCDLIIEAISEQVDLKQKLYEMVAPKINENAYFVTNTSGISITELAKSLPETLRSRFCGVHFFNPPRYMRLVELIPHATTKPEMITQLEGFLVSSLGKGVVHAKDTPNFIANRIGVFSVLTTFKHAEAFNIPFEVVDQLTGPAIGRAKSATFRTSDVVGLDTMAHVIQTMADHLPNDPWHAYYHIPEWMNTLIENKALGQKTRKGIFEKREKEFYVYDIKSRDYRLANQKADDDLMKALRTMHLSELFPRLQKSDHPQEQFLWACFRDLFHYSAYHLADIAESVRDVDLALRWGFGWKQGPFEIWQQADWKKVANELKQSIDNKKTLVHDSLPDWVLNEDAVYTEQGAYAPALKKHIPRSDAIIYQRQLYPDTLIGEKQLRGKTILETDDILLWHMEDGVAILSFKTKMNTVGNSVLDGILQAVRIAEKDFRALVLWQFQGDHFSVGANLKEFSEAVQSGKRDEVEQAVFKFQRASLALRYALVPTVAAIKGFTFGGGCELSLHCDRIVASFETYIGLVEAGVGLLPAGGGCKEFALRAAQQAYGDDLFHDLRRYYELIAKGITSTSGIDAKVQAYLRPSDIIIHNPNELLYVAKQQALAMAESGYRPPLQKRFPVAGRQGIANFKAILVNMLEGQMISEHDFLIATNIANVICGGDVDAGTNVNEEWLLQLERQAFVELAMNAKTQERILYTLKTGKQLRN